MSPSTILYHLPHFCAQGEGGLFHGDSYKQRFFVLARVPHATVLIYYGERTMDEENILGAFCCARLKRVGGGMPPDFFDCIC